MGLLVVQDVSYHHTDDADERNDKADKVDGVVAHPQEITRKAHHYDDGETVEKLKKE